MFRLLLLFVVITFEVCLRNVSSIVVNCYYNFEVCLRNVSSIVVNCGYNFSGLTEECFVYRYYLWLYLLRFA
jgi:hypothetical protein